MAQFAYKALTPGGEPVEGQMEAASEAEVIARIQEAGNLPLSASKLGEGFSLQNFRLSRRAITQKQVGEFTDQLATLLNSGMPLDRSLSVMLDLADDERLQAMIKTVRDKVRGGGNLSDALEEQHVFSKLYVNMVRAGEMGGTLEKTLQRLSDYQARSKALRDSVLSAMIYPAILLVLAVGSLFILLGKVVPSFQPMFEESGMQACRGRGAVAAATADRTGFSLPVGRTQVALAAVWRFDTAPGNRPLYPHTGHFA